MQVRTGRLRGSVLAVPSLVLAAAACGTPNRETVPESVIAPGGPAGPPPPDTPMPPDGEIVDRGELILRSAGEDIGHEKFTIKRAGAWHHVDLTAETSFPDPIAIELGMWVEPASWRLERIDLQIERGGQACLFRNRHRGDTVEVDVEYPDGVRQSLGREPREHAEHFVAIRPTITQTAICARADDQPRALESFTPWYVVRTAPRTPSTVATADGKGRLDLVKVDELIDVYCDGPRLAIVHYPKHAFIAARAEYDDAAQKLTAPDPIDERWAAELGCPARE